jgi:hypothetical protein
MSIKRKDTQTFNLKINKNRNNLAGPHSLHWTHVEEANDSQGLLNESRSA